VFQRILEMTITREEFLRLLPLVVGGLEVDGDRLRGRVAFDGFRGPWTIGMTTLPARPLGPVPLPRLRLDITLEDADENAGEAFLRRFRLAFLRGGG
jgi:hypothetical protein